MHVQQRNGGHIAEKVIYRIIEHGSTERSYRLLLLIKLCDLGPQSVMQLHGSSNIFIS